MNVKITKLNENAKLPVYSSAGSAGADLCYCGDEDVTLYRSETVFLHTGLSVAIPEGYVGLIYARSGLSCKRSLAPANKVGVIDPDYRGEIIIAIHNHGKIPQTIVPGERIAQLVITPCVRADFEICENLDKTERGEGSFGSTGRK